jgi:predicted transglutaminase-like cysteine proteinase
VFRGSLRFRVLLLALFAGSLAAQPASNLGTVNDEEIKRIVDTVGTSDTEKRVIGRRLTGWKDLAASPKYKSASDPEKLKAVNDFMHETPFYCDPVLWCKEDYWAKPVEFLSNDGGDCEDFSIAKYFTLRALGIGEDRLRIVYAVYQKPGFTGAHMVLAYYATPDAEPLILDNINMAVLPASSRPDLVPVFSFNTGGLWNAKESKGRGTDAYRAWSDHWKQVQAEGAVRSVSPEQRKGGSCQALIQASPWCR